MRARVVVLHTWPEKSEPVTGAKDERLSHFLPTTSTVSDLSIIGLILDRARF